MNIRLSGNSHIKVLIAFTLICLTLFLSSCGISDWSYDLPNGYEIVRVNSYSVVFGKNGRIFNMTIDRYVIAFCHNDSYIGLKRVPLDNVPFDERIDIDSYDDSNIEYYLIDAVRDIQYGPYTYEQYIEQCNKCDVTDMSDWIGTLKRPQNARS